MHNDQVFVKLDFKNAFNSLSRAAMRSSVASNIPDIYPIATSLIVNPLFSNMENFRSLLKEAHSKATRWDLSYFVYHYSNFLHNSIRH